LIEAIISLPPGLFYGTGIPACVLVVNKNRPAADRDNPGHWSALLFASSPLPT
jgi:type I restriction-modification system DNA methylase subunit